MSKVHWSEGKAPGDILWVTLCGQMMVTVAATPDEVTCTPCKRKLKKLPQDPAVTQYVEKVFEVHEVRPFDPETFSPPPALIDPVSDLPFVSQFTWDAVKDRYHYCAHCPTCVWFIEIEAHAATQPWKKAHRTESEMEWRFSSVSHALEWYYFLRADGFTMGTIGEALLRIGKLGTIIRGNSTSSRAEDEADDARAIDDALDECYQAPSPRGLSRNERLFCLFGLSVRPARKAHQVAEDIRQANDRIVVLTGPMVAAVAREGREIVYAYLRERGMVAPK